MHGGQGGGIFAGFVFFVFRLFELIGKRGGTERQHQQCGQDFVRKVVCMFHVRTLKTSKKEGRILTIIIIVLNIMCIDNPHFEADPPNSVVLCAIRMCKRQPEKGFQAAFGFAGIWFYGISAQSGNGAHEYAVCFCPDSCGGGSGKTCGGW